MSAEGKTGREELECWQPGRQAGDNAGKASAVHCCLAQENA